MDRADELHDIDTLLPPGGIATATDEDAGSTFVATRAELLVGLAEPPAAGPLSDRVQRAREQHEQMVQRYLIQPLLAWTLKSPDPVIRSVGVELATVFQALHSMGPLLLSQQARAYERAVAGASEPLPPRVFEQYLALTGRLSNLIRDLCQWQKT